MALIGALIGDPARANMLAALMSGKALTATELASEAGVTVQTASSHLRRLEDGGLLAQRKQGRHRYFSLADEDVDQVLEAMMGLAAKRGHLRTRTGPKDPALRKARVCYDHLAGEMGVRLFDSLIQQNVLEVRPDNSVEVTAVGEEYLSGFGIGLSGLTSAKRPVCRSCLDWSARRTHLAGGLGAAFLDRFYDLGWVTRQESSRVVMFDAKSAASFASRFPV